MQIQERNAELQALRQDSIRKDSIAQEERMRLKPSYFKGCWVNEQTLKSIGFQKIREIREPDDEFDLEDYFVYYSRTLNGRRIDLECWETMGSGVDIEFHNKAEKDQFVKELKKIAEQKSSNNYYISKYDYQFEAVGNQVRISQSFYR